MGIFFCELKISHGVQLCVMYCFPTSQNQWEQKEWKRGQDRTGRMCMQTKACLQGTQQEFFSDCLEKLITLVAVNFGLGA